MPGNSCLHAHGEEELVITLESWEVTRASRRVEEGLSRSFSGGGGKPSFPLTSAGDYRELTSVPLRGEECCGVGRASRDSAGSAQWKRASSRGEAGTSGFLSDSDSDCTVPAALCVYSFSAFYTQGIKVSEIFFYSLCGTSLPTVCTRFHFWMDVEDYGCWLTLGHIQLPDG